MSDLSISTIEACIRSHQPARYEAGEQTRQREPYPTVELYLHPIAAVTQPVLFILLDLSGIPLVVGCTSGMRALLGLTMVEQFYIHCLLMLHRAIL